MGEQKYLGGDINFFRGSKSVAKNLEFFCKEEKYSDLLV